MPISNRINMKDSLAVCGIITSACVAVWANKMPVLVLIFHVPNAVLLVSLQTTLMIITARGQWLREHRAVLWIAGHCFASTAIIVIITEKFVFARLFIATGFGRHKIMLHRKFFIFYFGVLYCGIGRWLHAECGE